MVYVDFFLNLGIYYNDVQYRHKYNNGQHTNIRKKSLLYNIYDGVTRRAPISNVGIESVGLAGINSYQKFMCSLHIRCSRLFVLLFSNRISHFKIRAMPYVYVFCSLLT